MISGEEEKEPLKQLKVRVKSHLARALVKIDLIAKTLYCYITLFIMLRAIFVIENGTFSFTKYLTEVQLIGK